MCEVKFCKEHMGRYENVKLHFFLSLFFLRRGSHYVALTDLELMIYIRYAQTHKDPPSSVSKVLRSRDVPTCLVSN